MKSQITKSRILISLKFFNKVGNNQTDSLSLCKKIYQYTLCNPWVIRVFERFTSKWRVVIFIHQYNNLKNNISTLELERRPKFIVA